MKIEICRPADLGELEVSQWRELQKVELSLANPFLGPEFAIVYSKHQDNVRVGVIRDDHEVVGFFPFEDHKHGVGRSLAYDIADCQALIIPADFDFDPQDLLKQCGLAVFEFDDLLPRHGQLFDPTRLKLSDSPTIDVSDGWNAWLADKKITSKSRIKRSFEKQRKMSREIGPISFEYDSRSHDDLEQLMAWKADQYLRTGRSDRFARPWFRNFVHDLFETRSDDFSVRLSRLNAGDTTVGLYLSVRSNEVLGSWFPTFDAQLGRYSPGMTGMLSLVEAAANDGIAKIALGKGTRNADYKQSLKNSDDQVSTGWAERPVLKAYVRRAQLAPRRMAVNFVTENPRLARAARTTLKNVGHVRTKFNR